ncbi:MAG TPA: hypothetical protein VFV09_08650 [Actinomycetota bacterium]|nr:hypothetical protein [Actinomycetota bacterium]
MGDSRGSGVGDAEVDVDVVREVVAAFLVVVVRAAGGGGGGGGTMRPD